MTNQGNRSRNATQSAVLTSAAAIFYGLIYLGMFEINSGHTAPPLRAPAAAYRFFP